jgi:hypothetical protein
MGAVQPVPSSSASALRAARTTAAPLAANARAVARPIPLDAPVTTATSSFALMGVAPYPCAAPGNGRQLPTRLARGGADTVATDPSGAHTS